MSTPRIDAHQHFWTLSRGDYGWLVPTLAPLYRDVEPAELRPLLARHAIDATVLVQAAPTEAETRFLLAIADAHPFVRGVVGWADLAAPDAVLRIDALAHHPALKGLRPMLHDVSPDDWVDTAPIGAALDAMAARGLVFDALVRPANLPPLLARVARHPSLAVVVDHGAKPVIGAGASARPDGDWVAAMRALAALPNVSCKLSGLLTEAPPGADAATLRPVVEVLLACFGPRRLIWGSDWPVLTLASTYDGWLEVTADLLRDASDAERAAIMGGNAARVYRLQMEPRR
ncbi:MAG: amidohydrolase [Lautropia sp.]